MNLVNLRNTIAEDPKRCKYGETKCILNAVNLILKERWQGDSGLDLGRLDPFPVDKLIIGKGGDGPIAIDLTFTNNKIYGLKTMQATSIKYVAVSSVLSEYLHNGFSSQGLRQGSFSAARA